jgi:PKD repeat protein
LTNFLANPTTGCAALEVDFTNSAPPEATSFEWDFGDGNSSTEANPTHIYDTIGEYTVIFRCSDSLTGCTSEYTINEMITTFGEEDIELPNQDTIYACSPYMFTADADNIGDSYWNWNFGDGTYGSGPNISHQYTQSGIYTVLLNADAPNACMYNISNYAIINIDNMEIDLNISLNDDCSNGTFNVVNNSTGVVQQQWNMGDNNSYSDVGDVNHIYNTSESYMATYEAVSDLGCIVTKHIPVPFNCDVNGDPIIEDPPPIIIEMPEDDTIILGPLTDPVTEEPIIQSCGPEFINLSTPYPSADSHFWDFGDGYTSIENDPGHLYAIPGTFDLKHYATYANGDVDTLIISEFVDQYILDANFTLTKTSLCNEANFEFENSSLNSSSWEWKLDNELISSDSIHNITLPLNDSVKTLSLRVEDEFGCFSESQQALFLYQPLALIEQDTFACNSSVVNFECSVIGEPGHSWNFDDGTIIGPDADTSITHTYTQNGFYEVILELNDQGCVREIKLDSLEIYQPNATFSPSNSSPICNTDSIFFIANESSYSTYNWTGGNIIGSGPSTWIQFNDEGKQIISLTISDRGCTGIINTDTIIVNKANAYFNYNQLNGCIPIDVEFEDSSVNPVNWVWSFGDGNFGSDEEFTHTYTSMPTDSVTLTITDINGCKDSVKSTIINELNADFFADDTIVCANTPIVFSGVDEVVNEWIWDFGDGNNSNDSVPTHSYQEEGIYQVELIVSDGNGCNDTVIKSSYIQVEKVESSFDFSDPGTCPPITTTFTNSSSGADNYVWDFGDGADNIINNNPIVYHTYDSSGSFSLSLVASNISGCTDTTTYSDSLVIPGPQLNFSIDQNIGCDSLTIIISDSSTSTLSYSWDFGDGNSEDIDPTTNIVTHTYTTIGSFNVVLVGSDNIVADNGCIGSYKSLDTIRIYPSPEISNSIQDTNLCLGTTFTALNSTLADSHSWLYNNQTYIGTSPEILIDYEGSEQLSYTATNTNGNCSTSQYYNLTSHQIPDVSIVDLGVICSNQGVTDFNSLNENILNDITWSGDAIVDADNGLFDPSLISGSTLITASFDSICNSQDSIIVIVENPPDATIITQDTSYCFGVTIQTPSVLNSGGQWYGDNVNPNTGEINGELSEGNHEYLYILENSNCSDSNSYVIEILHQNNATINADSIICDNLEIFTLSSVDTGGVWSGQFIDGSGVIDVTLTNPGLYNYYYEINGICPDLDSITIEVIEFIPAQINPPLDYCEGTDTIQLTATTTTGIWSGLDDTHDENGLFLTGSLSDSSYNVYYSLNNACPDVDTIDITILPQPDISIDIVQELPCVSYPVSVINNSTNLSTENYSWFVNDSLFYQNFSEPYFIFDTGFYQIKTIAINQYNCKSELSYEDIINIYDTTAHPNPTIIRSTVFENSSVYTEWKDTSLYLNPLGKNEVYRSINNEIFNFIIELDTNIHYFLDEDVDVFNNNYTYYITSKNVCEINSASSNIGNSILLNFQKPEEFKTKLLWNSYNQWDNGINRYEIQKLNEQSEWKVIQTLEDLNNSIIIDE